MAKKTIFLESAFWDKFSECGYYLFHTAEENDPVIVFEKISKWNDIYKFICRSSVFVDSTLSDLANKAHNDTFLQKMLKCNGDGKMELSELVDSFPNLESENCLEFNEDYSSLYLTVNDHYTAARYHGVINICLDSIWNQDNKFKDTGESVKKGKGFSWHKMEILREASNGMVIVDNFVLSPDKKTGECSIKYDLKELLRLMLPETSSKEYVLSIFYFDDSTDIDIQKSRRKQFSEKIREYITSQKRKLKIEIELFPTSFNGQNYQKDFHDRTIITNNVWIGSEAGFDLMVKDYTTNTNTRAIKSTATHGLYIGFGNDAAKWLDKRYDDFISDAKECLRKNKYTTQNLLLL